MKQKKIIHVCVLDKFIPPFIKFVEKNFAFERHVFVLIGDINKYPVQIRSNIIHITSRAQYYLLLAQMHLANKIILHSIFDKNIVKLLSKAPWLLKRCYWVIWGGDLYLYQYRVRNGSEDAYEEIRARVIRKMGHFVTYVKGDFELAQKWYGVQGEYHECLLYPSNLYKEYVLPPKNGTIINILVGNSATATNNQIEIFEKLVEYKDENMMIYCPLSYGDMEYAKQVAQRGKDMFGDRFVALMEFMPFEKYLVLLAQIDIAVFAHKRQQAMGNTICLLGLGKKVYMRKDVTPWVMFDELGVKVFDVSKLDLLPLNVDVRKNNQDCIKHYFSEGNLVKQWQNIFEG